MREVQDSIPSQGPHHIKDVIKNGTSSSLVLAVVAGMKKRKTAQNRQKSNAKKKIYIYYTDLFLSNEYKLNSVASFSVLKHTLCISSLLYIHCGVSW